MKTFAVAFASSLLLLAFARADIHDPPGNDYGPTRKFSRGVSNMFMGATEIPHQIAYINDREGNAAAASYGVVRGIRRTVARFGIGLYEFLFWPIPMHRDGYMPILPSDTHWKHAGFSEFPPELGYESKYPYTRHY